MGNVFYLFAFVAIVWELITVTSPRRVVNFQKRFNENTKDFGDWEQNQRLVGVFMLCYIAWTLIGLLSSQWIIFLSLLALGLIPKGMVVWRWIDSVISLALLIFMLLNVFHLHIDLLQWVKSFFS